MTDLAVRFLSSAATITGSNSQAQETQDTESAPEVLLTTADMLEFSSHGLSSLSDPASLSKPLGAQILGFGSVTARQSASTMGSGGSTVTHFTTEYEFSYFDLVNGTITKTVSSGVGGFASDGTNTATSSVYQGHTTCVTFDVASYRTGDLEKTLDSMSVAYEAKYVGLGSSYAENDLDSQRAQWRALYGAGKEAAAHSFAKMLGRFLSQESQSTQGKKVYRSVQGLFAAYEAKYRALTTSLGTKEWMQADLYEASISLKQLGASVELKEAEGPGLYTQRELEFAAVSLSAYQSAINAATLGGGGSEARQALRMSMVSMKVETMAYRGHIGRDMVKLLHTSGQNARQEMLDALDNYLAKRREEREEANQLFPAVDRELFDKVYDSVMGAFHKNGDTMNAIREGAAVARVELSSASEKAAAPRWTGELGTKGFWETFDNASYQGGIHAFEADWHEFLAEIDSSNRDLNMLA